MLDCSSASCGFGLFMMDSDKSLPLPFCCGRRTPGVSHTATPACESGSATGKELNAKARPGSNPRRAFSWNHALRDADQHKQKDQTNRHSEQPKEDGHCMLHVSVVDVSSVF